MNNDKADFTQGSILKKLIAFMIPVLGALILQAAYGAVDLLVVGRFGSTSGLSAVSTGSQVLNLVTFVVIQFAMGITVLIARYLGEKKPQQIGAVVGGASIVFTLISAVLFVVMVFFARPIAILMQAPEAAVDQTAASSGRPRRPRRSRRDAGSRPSARADRARRRAVLPGDQGRWFPSGRPAPATPAERPTTAAS